MLIVIHGVPRRTRDPATPPLPGGTLGFGEGLFVRVLLWVHLFIHEVTGDFITIIDLQL